MKYGLAFKLGRSLREIEDMPLLEFRTWLMFFTEMNEEPTEHIPDASEMSGDALAAMMGAAY